MADLSVGGITNPVNTAPVQNAPVQSATQQPKPQQTPVSRTSELPEKNTPAAQADLSRETENIASVSVSEDGDVVAVSENGVRALDAEEKGAALRDENEDIALLTEGQTNPAIQPETVTPVETPEVAEELAEEEPAFEPEITSFVGYTDNQVEQLYHDGRISYNDYQQTIEAREEQREAEQEEMSRDTETLAAEDGLLRRTDDQNIVVNNLQNPNTNTAVASEAVDAMARIDGTASAGSDAEAASRTVITGNVSVDNGASRVIASENRAAVNERKVEEEGRLWDYQLRA